MNLPPVWSDLVRLTKSLNHLSDQITFEWTLTWEFVPAVRDMLSLICRLLHRSHWVLSVCSPLQHVPDYTRYRPVPHHWTPGLKLSQRTTGSYHTAGRRNSTGLDCCTAGSWRPPSAASAWTKTGDRGWIYTRYEAEIHCWPSLKTQMTQMF